MLKPTPKKRVLFVRRLTPVLLAVFGVFSLVFANVHSPKLAYAATSSTINFQARLQSRAGAIVPDGDYNVEFKLYNSDVSTATSQGSCTADTVHCLWVETRTGSDKVHVVNGYLSVQLGSVNAFGSNISWSQNLWLTMNIGGTGTASWDGEMDPRLPLTAVPYAFTAGSAAQLDKTSDGFTSTLSIQAPTVGDQTFQIQNQGAAGTYNILTAPTGQDGYVKLQSGTVSQQIGSLSVDGTITAANAVLGNGGLSLGSGDISLTNGTITLGGTTVTDFHTPVGSTVHTKINIPTFDPGAFGQVIALGIPSTNCTGGNTSSCSARVISIFDARTTAHQPSISIFSPDENNVVGFSWDGDNSLPLIKSTTSKIGFSTSGSMPVYIDNSGSAAVLQVGIAGPSGKDGALVLSNATTNAQVTIRASNATSSYTIQLPSSYGSTGQCMTISGVSSNVETFANNGCFIQGGSSFGTAANLGTADNNALNLVTNGSTRATIAADGSNITLAGNTDLILQGATGYISDSQGQTSSEAFGLGATVGGDHDSTAVGANAASDAYSAALGANSHASNGSVAIGSGSTATGSGSLAIGKDSAATFDSSIAIGVNAASSAANQLVIGSSSHAITQAILGNGPANATPVGFTLQATSTLAGTSNTAGGSITIAGGQGTGTGAGGDINFQIAKSGTNGSSQNALSTVASISGTTGAATFQNAANSTTAFQVQKANTDTVLDIDTSNGRVGIGTNAPSRVLDVVTNNSLTNAPSIKLEQQGTGDTSIEFKDANGKSYFVGMDQSSGGTFKIASSTSAATSFHVGNDTLGGSTQSNLNGEAVLYKVTSGGTGGTVNGVTFYASAVDPSDPHVRVALYANDAVNGRPGALIASSASTTASVGYNTVPISATISASTSYWVGVNVEGVSTSLNYTYLGSGASPSDIYYLGISSAWPDPAGAPNNGPYGSNEWVFYLDVTPSGAVDSFGGTSLFSLTDQGALTLQNSVDTGAAFQVQNAAGSSMFNVDTSAQKVTIGPSGGDSTGTILVLGTKTGSASDPTGVDGAMYYNATLDEFRCYSDGVWRSCMANARTSYHYTNEMLSDISDDSLEFNHVGNGGSGYVDGETGHPGIAQIGTGTTTPGTVWSYAGMVGRSSLLLGNGDYWRYETVLRLPTAGGGLSNGTDRYRIEAGFDDDAASDGVDGCYFKYSDNNNSGKWQGVCRSNSVESTCDVGITVATDTWYRLTVVVNSAGDSTDFQVNGVSKCQVTSNIPTGAGRNTRWGNQIIKDLGSSNRYIDLDYTDVQAQFGTSR